MQEATLHAGDPQGDPLSGQIRISPEEGVTVQMLDLSNPTCDRGIFPDGYPGPGIGILNAGFGLVFFDIDSVLSSNLGLTCLDGQQDFELSALPCAQAGSYFAPAVQVDNSRPAPYSFCVRRVGASAPLAEFTVLEILDTSVR